MVAATITGLISALVIAKSFDEFRRGREPWPVFTVWLLTWSSVALVAIFPQVTDWVRLRILGPDAGIGTIVGIVIVFLLFLCYRLYLKAERVERTLNQLISDLALHELKRGKADGR